MINTIIIYYKQWADHSGAIVCQRPINNVHIYMYYNMYTPMLYNPLGTITVYRYTSKNNSAGAIAIHVHVHIHLHVIYMYM